MELSKDEMHFAAQWWAAEHAQAFDRLSILVVAVAPKVAARMRIVVGAGAIVDRSEVYGD